MILLGADALERTITGLYLICGSFGGTIKLHGGTLAGGANSPGAKKAAPDPGLRHEYAEMLRGDLRAFVLLNANRRILLSGLCFAMR